MNPWTAARGDELGHQAVELICVTSTSPTALPMAVAGVIATAGGTWTNATRRLIGLPVGVLTWPT